MMDKNSRPQNCPNIYKNGRLKTRKEMDAENKPEEWATISPKGELLKFDIEECKKIASLYNEGNREQGACIAKLALLLIQEQKEKDAEIAIDCAKKYDDITKYHSGRIDMADEIAKAISDS